MSPDDIPTEITKLTYGRVQALGEAGLPVLSQNQTAVFLAHYWPAIEKHVAVRLADRLEAGNPDRGAEFSEGVDWCVGELRALGAGQ